MAAALAAKRIAAYVVLAGLMTSGCRSSAPSLAPTGSSFQRLVASARDLGSVARDQQISVSLRLKDATVDARSRDLAAMYRAGSPTFARFKTLSQVESDYGPAADAVRQAQAALHDRGLAAEWQPGSRWLAAVGPADRVEEAFGVTIHNYSSQAGRRFYATRTEPSVPTGLQRWIDAVADITDYGQYHTAAIPSGGLKPIDLLKAYDMTPLRDAGFDGAGETVVFLEIDGFDQADLDAYTSGSSSAPMQPELKAGPTLKPGGEAEMDLEVVHAIAPGARLVVYNSTPRTLDLLKVEQQAIDENPGAIFSVSLGLCDLAQGAANSQREAEAWDRADLLGETVFVASGDSGAFTCLEAMPRGTLPDASSEQVSADMPSSAPGVTAVGGTRLSVRGDGSWYNETVWENPPELGGSGGNISAYFPMPEWQKGRGVQNQFNSDRRSTPDVAADADPVSGVRIYVQGEWGQGGGTSQAAPIWAGMTALINQYLKRQGLQGVGFLNPALYELANGNPPFPPLHDIVIGTNLVYPATPGYDLATGLGTPIAWNLARDLEAYQRAGGK